MKNWRWWLILVFPCLVWGCVSMGEETSEEKGSPATLVVTNDTPYEISGIYAQELDSGEWSDDLFAFESLYPGESREISLAQGEYLIQADILVDDYWYTVEEGISFSEGKNYAWNIDSTLFDGFNQSYGYLEGGYGYLGG